MILFFDKNIGTALPKALEMLKPPFQVEYHQKYFPMNEPDDKWLPVVGSKKWTVIGHDRKFHENQNELEAIKKYQIGGFYLWGAEELKWEKAKVFFKALEQINTLEKSSPRPFVFSIKKNGHAKRVKLPN
jgi:hypothetical protein